MRNTNDAGPICVFRSVAFLYQALGKEITDLGQRMRARSTAANAALMALNGVGPVVGAQLLITAGDNPDRLLTSASFAALCATAPIPISPGRTDRRRLSWGGDRRTNAELHHIVKVWLSHDPTTQVYRETHLAKGWTNAAIFRALKRAVARQIFQIPSGQCAVPDYSGLRPAHRAQNLTLTAAARHRGVWLARIGELELGRWPNDDLAHPYRQWLRAA